MILYIAQACCESPLYKYGNVPLQFWRSLLRQEHFSTGRMAAAAHVTANLKSFEWHRNSSVAVAWVAPIRSTSYAEVSKVVDSLKLGVADIVVIQGWWWPRCTVWPLSCQVTVPYRDCRTSWQSFPTFACTFSLLWTVTSARNLLSSAKVSTGNENIRSRSVQCTVQSPV